MDCPARLVSVGLTYLTLSCAAGAACRSRSGAAVAAHDVRRTESRSATAVTPPRLRQRRQLGCRAEAGPHQLQREVSRRRLQHNCRMRRLPLIDWDSLRNKPPLILRNITKFAAFGLLSAEAYSGDIAAGTRPVSINTPDALFHLGPEFDFSPEMLAPFRSWIVSCALRDSVELILKHLDDIRDVLAICSLPPEDGVDSATWQKRVVEEGRQFHRWFLKRKLEHLADVYAFAPSDDINLFVTIAHARNCLVHRDGIVFDEDKNEQDGLVVRWPAQNVTVSNPGEQPQLIERPGAKLMLGGSFEIQAATLAKTFAPGKRITFTPQELNEIGAFLSAFTIDLAFRAQKRARQLVGLPEHLS